MARHPQSLGIIGAIGGHFARDRLHVHASFGRIVDLLADRYDRVILSVPTIRGDPPRSRDHVIASDNVELVPQPGWTSSFAALRYPRAICRSFRQVCDRSQVVFIRGLQPYLQYVYWRRAGGGPAVVHWLVGDPIAGMRFDASMPPLWRRAITAYTLLEQASTRWLSLATRSTFVANGQVLADKYRTPRTHAVVSSTIRESEFHFRDDTCIGDVVRICYVGFIRPGKGLEFLLRAMTRLSTRRSTTLAIIGDADKYAAEFRNIENLIATLGLTQRVTFEGYAEFGEPLFSQMRRSDLLVLPTLSEGTPRVLVEARAQGLPVVATHVGGIPTSVTDGYDGLLVPPADAESLARAIDRVIDDGDLRRRLIANGRRRAAGLTVERFVERIDAILQAALCGRRRRV